MDNPFSVFEDGLAWYSMEGSFNELRQMAQVSAQMSQDHIAQAFHFLITKRSVVAGALAAGVCDAEAAAASPATVVPRTPISTLAILPTRQQFCSLV